MKKIIIAVSLLAVMASCAKERVPAGFTKGIDLKCLVSAREHCPISKLHLNLLSMTRKSLRHGIRGKRGNVVYEKSFGHKDLETMAPAEIDDIYVLFSQDKSHRGGSIHDAVRTGTESKLDDPISKWIPDSPTRSITGFDEETGEG